MTEDIINGFNSNNHKRTVANALNLERAFDTVNIDQLIQLIITSMLRPQLKIWLANYLRGRNQRLFLVSAISAAANLKADVPQGSVL